MPHSAKKYITCSKCSSDTETRISLCVCVCQWMWDPLGTHFLTSKILYKFTLLTLILIFVDREQPVQHVLINCILPYALFSGLPTMWAYARLGMLVVCWLPVQNIWSQTATVSFDTHAAPCPAHIHLSFSRFTSSHSKKLNHSLWPCLEYSVPGMPSSAYTETLSIPATHPVDCPVLQFLYIDAHTAKAAPQFQSCMPHT